MRDFVYKITLMKANSQQMNYEGSRRKRENSFGVDKKMESMGGGVISTTV